METIESLQKLPRLKGTVSGVYFLWDNDELVYIGSSINVFTRFDSHKKENQKTFDSFSVIEIKDIAEMKYLEAKYILHFMPKYNKTVDRIYAQRLGWYSIAKLIEKLELTDENKIIKLIDLLKNEAKSFNILLKTFDRGDKCYYVHDMQKLKAYINEYK